MSEIDFIAENGDRWVVRGCDAEDGCIVVERFMLRNPPQGLDKLVDDFAREATGQPPRATEEVPDDEADDDIHIPAGVVQAIAAALASSKPSPASDLQDAHRKGIADGISSVASDLEGGLPWAVEWNHEGRTMVLAIEADGSFDFTEFKGGEVVHMHTWKPKPSAAFVAMRTALESIRDGDLAYSLSNRDYFQEEAVKIAAAALALAEKETGK